MTTQELITAPASLRNDYKGNQPQVSVQKLTKTLCENYPFEILGEYTKLYYDLDWDKEDNGVKKGFGTYDKAFHLRLRKHFREIQSHYQNEFCFTDGSYEDKYSFHIIFQRHFIKREKKVPREDILQWLLGEFFIVLRPHIDKGVYDPNRKLRLPYGTYENETDPSKSKLNVHVPYLTSDQTLTSCLVTPVCSRHDKECECTFRVQLETEVIEEKEEVKVETEEDVADRQGNLKKYLEVIKKERFQERSTWITLAGLMRSNGLKREDFIRYSKESGYAHFNEEDCNKTWYSLKENAERSAGFPTLQRWCDEDGINWREMFCPKSDKMIKMLMKGLESFLILSHKTVAEVFYEYYKDNLYYVGKDWLHYDKSKGWEFGDDNSIVFPLMKFVGERFSSYVHSIKKPDGGDEDTETQYKRYKKFCIKESAKLADYSFCNKCVKTGQSLFRNDKILSEFDAYPDWFCFSNHKAILMTTGDVIDIKQTHKILSTCGYPMPEKSLDSIQRAKDFILSIQTEKSFDSYMSCIATAFYGTNKNQRLFIHTGEGSNGKSLVGKLIYWTLGDYAMTFPIEQLTQGASGRNTANSDLAQSRGKRYAQSNEPEESKEAPTLKIAKVKELTGEETVKTRDLHKSSFELLVSFTIHLLCNDPPKLSKSDKAIERRLECITYPYCFKSEEEVTELKQKYDENQSELTKEIAMTIDDVEKRRLQEQLDRPFTFRIKDEDLGKKLKQDKEIQFGLLYLALEHWKKTNGVFSATEEMKRKKEDYVLDNNPLQDWLRGYDKIDGTKKENKGNFIRANVLLKEFKTQVDESMKIKKFNEYLLQARVCIVEDLSNGNKVYLKKKQNDDDE